MPFNTRRWSKTLFAALAVSLSTLAPAQPATRPAVPRGGLNPDSFYGKESFQGVSVRDSLEAVKKIEDARRMERLEDWNKAADWYQEVIEKYGQYVVPSATDPQNNITQYTGIERPVQEQLAKWPKAGLDAYRNRYGAAAKSMLDQARPDDRETLSRVMKLYFVTEAGKQAGIRLIDLLLEGGEFAEAARVGDRLLDWHPTLEVERPKVLFRTALAYHLSGDETKAGDRAQQLKTKFAAAVGTLFGKDVVLAQALERMLKLAPPVTVATSPNSVRMNPGGDESRSMISAAKGRPGARMASVEYTAIPAMTLPQGARINRRIRIAQETAIADQSAGYGVLPVADAGELYFQDGSHVYAVSLQSGVPLPGWTQSYPNSGGQYAVNSFGNVSAEQHALTLTDTSVLGIMGYSDRFSNYGYPSYGNDRGTRLVCLDRATGKEKWVARPNKISEENLRALDLSGSPLVVGDNVYVIGRGGKNMTSEDCYVLCFDVNSGNYKWSCFIASSNAASGYNQFSGQFVAAQSFSHLAYSSGRVYILTNIGALAAIDAYSGTVSWLDMYPRDAGAVMNPNMGWSPAQRSGPSNKAWEYNAVIVQDGRVFALPTDSKFIMVYDAGTGAEIRRIDTNELRQAASGSLAVQDSAAPQAMLGVDGHQIFLTGGPSVYCIDWTDTTTAAPIVWHCGFATPIVGRGFVTSDSVFVCTESGRDKRRIGFGALHRIERFNSAGEITGKVVNTYPKDKDWDDGEGPGNIVVVGDNVIVAGAKGLNVYADLGLARKRLDDEVAAAPSDPEPRLRYAEVMFVAGRLPLAMEKLHETVTLLGGLQSLRPGPQRDHLFSDCLTFAAKLQKDVKNRGEASADIQTALDSVAPLYDLAAAAADNDAQQVNYRISRAKFHRDFKEGDSLARAVTLYQQILANRRYRAVPLNDESQGTLQAAEVVEQLIAAVKKISPESYETFEKQAADALAAAGNDPALLKNIAETYPNSAAAPRAMINAAAAFEAQGNAHGYGLAALTLRQVYNKYPGTADKAVILEAMARNYLAMPETTSSDRIGTASARLSSIVKMGGAGNKLSKPLTLHKDNKVLAAAGVTILDALKALQNYKAQVVSGKLPDFHIPGQLAQAPTERQKEEFMARVKAWKTAGADPATQPEINPAFVTAPDQQVVLDDISSIVKPPEDLRGQFARYDRIVVWSKNNLQIYSIGQKTPIAASAELAGEPRNLAWLDASSLLVWSDGEMVLLDGNTGAKKWKLAIKSLPKVEVLSGGITDDDITGVDDNAGGQTVINNNGQRIFTGRRIINGRIVGGMAIQQPLAQAAPAGGAPAITDVRPMEDKIILSTNDGQLAALRLRDGGLAWHLRLAAGDPISRIAATDDFTVAKVDDSSNTQLVIVNTYDGQLVRRLSFSNEANNQPVNFALAADGTLVWTQVDRLCGKDLFEPGKEPSFEVVAGQTDVRNRNANAPIYAGAGNPDQLLISEGRILAVNTNGRFVSIHSLETGKLLDFEQPDGRRAEARLSTSSGDGSTAVNDWGVALHVVGSRLYVCSRMNGPMAYDLDKGLLWTGTYFHETTAAGIEFQEPFIGQDHFVLIERRLPKAGPGNAAASSNTIRIHCYGMKERGRVNHFPFIRDDSGISQIQGVEGGFYYLTGDKKLRFLKGARP